MHNEFINEKSWIQSNGEKIRLLLIGKSISSKLEWYNILCDMFVLSVNMCNKSDIHLLGRNATRFKHIFKCIWNLQNLLSTELHASSENFLNSFRKIEINRLSSSVEVDALLTHTRCMYHTKKCEKFAFEFNEYSNL